MEMQITLNDIIEDLVAVEPLLLNYEKKYKVRTPHFYKLYKKGGLEGRWDFIDWAGLYEIKLDREETYEQLANEAIQQLPLRGHLKSDNMVNKNLLDFFMFVARLNKHEKKTIPH